VKNRSEVLANLICEGECNPGLRAADEDLSAMPAFAKRAVYTPHKALHPGSVIFRCQECGWNRRFGGNSDMDSVGQITVLLNAADGAFDA
jgi:hypothetical protein